MNPIAGHESNWPVLDRAAFLIEHTCVSQCAPTIHVHGATKTGKAISAAAKGAAVGGPYGAAAGLALTAGRYGKKLMAGAVVVLLLPVLFVLMLPSLIFGGLTSGGYGCGPTAMSIVVSSLTNEIVDPIQMANGRPIVMAADQFQQLTGERLDPAECCGQFTGDGFKALFAQYLLWHIPPAEDDLLHCLWQNMPGMD